MFQRGVIPAEQAPARAAAYEQADAKFIPAEDVFAKARLITGL
jgi:hypothetical protein